MQSPVLSHWSWSCDIVKLQYGQWIIIIGYVRSKFKRSRKPIRTIIQITAGILLYTPSSNTWQYVDSKVVSYPPLLTEGRAKLVRFFSSANARMLLTAFSRFCWASVKFQFGLLTWMMKLAGILWAGHIATRKKYLLLNCIFIKLLKKTVYSCHYKFFYVFVNIVVNSCLTIIEPEYQKGSRSIQRVDGP